MHEHLLRSPLCGLLPVVHSAPLVHFLAADIERAHGHAQEDTEGKKPKVEGAAGAWGSLANHPELCKAPAPKL